jgi:hypothetical protein
MTTMRACLPLLNPRKRLHRRELVIRRRRIAVWEFRRGVGREWRAMVREAAKEIFSEGRGAAYPPSQPYP